MKKDYNNCYSPEMAEAIDNLKTEVKKELKKILKIIIFNIGKYNKRVRIEYNKETGKYPWGLIRFIKDDIEPNREYKKVERLNKQ